MSKNLGIWFPAIRTNTGTDVFTERLVKGLTERGIKAGVTWLPLRAEFAPWTVSAPKPPEWATIVHANTWLHPRFIPENLPLVATLHHSVHHPDALAYKGRIRSVYHKYWIAPLERRVMRRATKVIAVSQFVAGSANQALMNMTMEVIYNGVDMTVFKPGKRVRKPDEPFRLLYVGSWIKRKGVDLLAPIMRELGNSFELYYTGGPASEKDKKSMPPNMHDIGRLQGEAAVVAAMQNADALLFPSRSEGHPLVGIEAMACGLPVVAMNGSSLSEIIEHKENGYLCKRENIPEFVSSVRSIAEDSFLHKKISNAAQLSVERRFSENIMLKSYIHRCYTQV